MPNSDERGSGLRGRRILFTRPAGDGERLAALLAPYGAELIELPLVEIRAVRGAELARVEEALDRLGQGGYDGLLITSQTTVQMLEPLAASVGVDLAAAPGRVFAVGNKTAAALGRLGLQPLVPELATGEGLLAAVRAAEPELDGRAFLFPRARQGREGLVAGLRASGARVDALPLYDTLPAPPPAAFPAGIDWLTFTSPSAVEVFCDRGHPLGEARIACLGPTTAAAAEDRGLRVDLVPAEQTLEAMLAAMADA